MSIKENVGKFNEWIAVKGTLAFGNMWMTYLFFLYGFGPVLYPAAMEKMLYWSNTVQLWSLPLIMVGTNILGRITEKLITDMYSMIKDEFSELKAIRMFEQEELAEIRKLCAGCKYNQPE
jgi:hypothetical protein